MFFPKARKLEYYYKKGYITPLVLRLGKGQDPFRIYKLFRDKPYSFFLDSVSFHKKTGRFSYIGWDPFLVFRSKKNKIILEVRGRKKTFCADPIDTLKRIFKKYKGRKWEEIPFFSAGAVGYFGYELSRLFEKLPSKAKDDLGLPDIFLFFLRELIVFDNKTGESYLIYNIFPRKRHFSSVYKEGILRLRGLADTIKIRTDSAVAGNGKIEVKGFGSNFSREEFSDIVLRCKEHIKAGDIYQANLSQRFSFDFKGDPLKLYDNLRRINPSPFSSFFNFGSLKVASCSPERLIKLDGRLCETRPIAGTRPRGANARETRRLSRELILNEKEKAEHIMLVDLERNDLGRVCEYDTVRVDELMVLEKYSHVIHIVSNVIGRLKKDRDRFDLIRTMFPGGTITGCPKIRCMEIIDELEPCARSLYTGSIGTLDFNGDMDLNIVIRTLILKEDKGYIQVGAGIVYDSQPDFEYEETVIKAQALIEALKAG